MTEIPKNRNGGLDQIKLQTGSRRGTLKMGTEHPEFSDLAFEQYTPKKADRGYVRPPEYWTHKEVLEERMPRRLQHIKDTRRRRQLWISNYKTETGCVKTKLNSARRLTFRPMKEIKKLIDSGIYQVLCAICHRVKTFEQKDYYNKAYTQS